MGAGLYGRNTVPEESKPSQPTFVEVACSCGKWFRVSTDAVGKRAKCTACGETQIIQPAGNADEETSGQLGNSDGSSKPYEPKSPPLMLIWVSTAGASLGGALLGALAGFLFGALTGWLATAPDPFQSSPDGTMATVAQVGTYVLTGVGALVGFLMCLTSVPAIMYRRWLEPDSIHEPEKLATVISLLVHPRAGVRKTALQLLREIGAKAYKAIPNLLKLLESKAYSDRYWAMRTLAAIGDKAAVAASKIMERFVDQRERIALRVAAADALVCLRAKNAAPLVAERFIDQNEKPAVRIAAARALGGLGDVRAIPILQRAVSTEKGVIQSAASEALTSLKRESSA